LNPRVHLRGGHRRLGAFLVVLLATTTLNLVTPRPAAASLPQLSVTGTAACNGNVNGYIDFTWTLSEVGDIEGRVVSLTYSPNTNVSYFPTVVRPGEPITMNHLLPPGLGATAASVTVGIEFTLPDGPQVVNVSGYYAPLPRCPGLIERPVGYEKHCDGSVLLTMTYSAVWPAATTVRVDANFLRGTPWNTSVVIQPGGTATVLVPAPYAATYIEVTQGMSIMAYLVSANIPLPAGCPPPPTTPAGGPGNPAPPAGPTAGGPSGGGPGGGGSTGGATLGNSGGTAGDVPGTDNSASAPGGSPSTPNLDPSDAF